MRGQGRKKWRKWVALVAATGMLIGQGSMTSVWAEEAMTIDTLELAEEETAEARGSEEFGIDQKELTETITTVSGSDAAGSEDVEGILTEESLTIEQAADNIASGRDGNITWIIDGSGKLTVEGTGDLSESPWSENFAWASYREQITFAEINVTGMMDASYLFRDCPNMKSLDLAGFDTRTVTNMQGMFYRCSGLNSLDVSNFDTANVKNMSYMFSGCSKLESLDISNFDTNNVTNMETMFQECSSLTSLDISNFDTGNVKDMSFMFCNCSGLTSLNLGELDTGNVGNMTFMFTGCSGLTDLDVSSFETGNVKNMACMFSECSSLTSLDISNFDTKNVTSEYGMNGMFAKCSSLKSLNVSGLNTENVVNMSAMFLNCSSLDNLDVSSFDTGKVMEIWGMFSGCSSLKSLDVSNFDTRNVTNMNTMFSGCSNLTDLDISSFDTTNVKEMTDLLASCTSLQKVNTPKVMGTDTIELPAAFISVKGRETQILSKDFCNTVLTRKSLSKPAPVKFTVTGVIGGRNVAFNNDSEDTVIYYSSKTSNLTTNDACVKPGETVLFENFYGTIYAKAYANGQWSNVSRLVLKIPVVNKPTITSKDGVVTIKTTTPDSYIYYTTDGSTPSPTNGTRLAKSGGSFTVPANCTVKAIAVRSCFTNSEVASASVAAKKLGAPSFVVKGVIGGREVTFNTTETKGEIYYSFTTSNITTKDLHVKPGEKVLFQNYYGTVYARTYVNGQWSNVSRLILKIPVVNKPTITAVGNGKVKISTSTPDCAIYYTTDGSTPSPTNGTRINASSSIVTVGSGKTVKAIAVRSCFTSSDVATYR